MKRLLLILLFVSLPALALAQPTSEDPSTTPTQWYGSVAGIVAATMIGVGILKRILANVNVLNQLPVWLYAVVLSAGLTTLANMVWHTLPGDLWQLLTQSVIMAATASGFYEWFNSSPKGVAASITKPLAESTTAQDQK